MFIENKLNDGVSMKTKLWTIKMELHMFEKHEKRLKKETVSTFLIIYMRSYVRDRGK